VPLTRRRTPSRAGFSLIEMLVALTITSLLLTAALVALDSSFKGYKVTTEGASTHVVTRIVMQRVMAMIRTGTEFGPYPADVLDRAQNPIRDADHIEFVTYDDGTNRRVVRIERREATEDNQGPFELWYIQTDYADGAVTGQNETPLITNLQDARFSLEFDVGPRLRRATVDITVRPNDVQDANIGGDLLAPTIRLISSAVPRRLD
jgi:prepilin-type N-terminal cleavage/methylation domain-containing protein